MAWDTGTEGYVTLACLTGWQTAVLANAACGLRLESARAAGDAPPALQLALTPAQALALAEDLRRMATLATQRVPPGTRRS